MEQYLRKQLRNELVGHPDRFCGGKQPISEGRFGDSDRKFSGFEKRRVEMRGGGTLKISIFTKRVHFWASLVRPRLP